VSLRAISTDAPVTNLKTLPTARLDTHRSRYPRTHLTTTVRASQRLSASNLGNTSQQVLIEALPPVLALHLDHVRYNVAAGGITKIGKSIHFAPELEIPLGTIFTFLAATEVGNAVILCDLVILDVMVLNAQ
jgi:hypothetical protein